MLDLHDIYTIQYAKDCDKDYDKCNTCEYYSGSSQCSNCNKNSNYKFGLICYQKQHDEEIAKWIEERRKKK